MATPASAFGSLVLPLSTSEKAYPAFENNPTTEADFRARAEEVAVLLAEGIAHREQKDEPPYREVQLLKDSGLLTAIGLAKYGGGGLDYAVGLHLVRIVARGDGSIAQLLGYHYVLSRKAKFFGTPEQFDRSEKRWIEGRLLYGSAVNPRDSDLVVEESKDGKHLAFHGRKAFSTGSKVSDLALLEGAITGSATHVFGVVDVRESEITYGNDWNGVLGMRGSQSGSITIKRAEISWDDALGFVNQQFVSPGVPYSQMFLPSIQLTFATLYLGIAEGALAKAVKYTVANTRGWPYSAHPVKTGTDEHYVQELVGTLQAKLWGLEAQIDSTLVQFDRVENRSLDERSAVTAKNRADLAIQVAASKINAHEIGLDVTSRIYEVMGARSLSFNAAFDHFWRNIRTHTLHDPVAHKRAEVGRYVLVGELPTPSPYA